MKGAILTVAVAAVVATAAVAVADSMGTATAKPRGQADVVVRKKLNNIYRKLGGLARQTRALQMTVESNQGQTDAKLSALDRNVTNVGTEVGRIWRCVRRLDGYSGSCL